jgi:hypothetical protein
MVNSWMNVFMRSGEINFNRLAKFVANGYLREE